MLTLKTEKKFAVDAAQVMGLREKIQKDNFGGWTRAGVGPEELAKIKKAAKKIQKESDYLVCIGIGGSYLGHRAVIEALGGPTDDGVEVLYAGNSLSEFELKRILDTIEGYDFSVNVISKSGTTTEPAVAFRIFKQALIEKYGKKGACERIYATTDQNRGALHDEAEQKGYTSFVVPDDVGGRYSVLTAVGLLPIAAAGIDIDDLLAGAQGEARRAGMVPAVDEFGNQAYTTGFDKTDAYKYAIVRAYLAKQGYTTEVLATFEPRMSYFNEWWKQLFGESEGKENQGVFPASVVYTTDLHSMGQYMQQGSRKIFETVLSFENSSDSLVVPEEDGALDGLTYLQGRKISEINTKAAEATITAHRAGGIPVFELQMPELSIRSIGEMIYFFELACAVSAMLQGVNPFDQPGVEQYKREMFRLLGKPGF